MREPLLEKPFGADICSNNCMIFNKKASFSGNIRLPNDPEKEAPKK
jgi:hypothetical protein